MSVADPFARPVTQISNGLAGRGSVEVSPEVVSANDAEHLHVDHLWRRLIAAHIDAIRTVFHNRITGDGGDVGRDLMAEIAAAVKKYR